MDGDLNKPDWIPRPDPTKLTTEQLDREVASLKEIIFTRLAGMEALSGQRLDEIQRQFLDQSEKFGVITQASKEAVEKALASAKEAIVEQNRASDLATTKSEANFTKAIDQQRQIIESQSKSNDVQVGDIKERLNKLEGMALGKFDTEKQHRDNSALYVAILVAIIAAIGLFYHR